MVKLFMYLSDVQDLESGPLTLFPREIPRRLRKGFIPAHLNDNELSRTVDHSEAIVVSGPSLTSFLANTSKVCHMGGRVLPGRERILYTALYIPEPSIYPGKKLSIRVGTKTLSPVERALIV